MDVLAELAELEEADGFVRRHIGPSETEVAAMLQVVGAATLDDRRRQDGTAPRSGPTPRLMLPPPIDEAGGDRRTASASRPATLAKNR